MPETVVVVIRSTASYLVLLLLARMMGKKLVSQLTFFDYIVGITIGSIAAEASVDLDQTAVAVLSGAAVWAILTVVVGWLALRSVTFNKLVQGEPTPLVRDGRVLEANMRKERYNLEDLLMQLRIKNVFRLEDVEAAFLEPNGQLSVLLRGDRQPLTGRAAGISVPDEEAPTVVVWDGQVMHDSLHSLGRDRRWLERELAAQGVSSVEEVYLAQYDPGSGLYVDRYDDGHHEGRHGGRARRDRPQAARLLRADLLRFQAEMEHLAADAPDGTARKLFEDLAREAAAMEERLRPLLR